MPLDRLRLPPSGPFSRIAKAAKSDLKVARLVYGLCGAIAGRIEASVFAGYSGGLIDWQNASASLNADMRTLVAWALKPNKIDAFRFYFLSQQTAKMVTTIRRRSPLGRKFRQRAMRLSRRYPLLKIPHVSWAWPCSIMPEAVGKPLTKGIIVRANSIAPGRVQILRDRGSYWEFGKPGALSIHLAEDGYTIKNLQIVGSKPIKTAPLHFKRRVEGNLINFAETGTEGTHWMVEDEESYGYEALAMISEGDHLTVTDELGKKVWRGTIRCDRKTGWTRYPLNPKYGQQTAMGYWVHWIQAGFKPDDWAAFFIRPDYDRLRGVLVRRNKPTRRRSLSRRK